MKLGRPAVLPEKKRIVHISVPVEDIDHFQRLYEGCLNRFVRNAVKKAVSSKEFFDKLYFNC